MADEEVQQVTSTAVTEERPDSAETQPEGQVGEHERTDSADPQAKEGDVREGDDDNPVQKRINQIWARAKEAERKAEALAAEAQREREARIRLEERAKAKEEATATPEKEYSWVELRQFISEGKLTLDQAIEYREDITRKQIKREAQATIDSHLKLNTRESTIDTTLARYRSANPNLVKDGTPEREKLVQEYKYHVEVLGMPATRATELAAARAAFGDIDALESQARLKAKPVEREAMMETTTNARPAPKTKDPVEQLDARQKEHYTRMIKNGRYGSYRPQTGITADHWKAVREELTWKRP